MQLGIIGLGRMAANMVRRLLRGGHECAVYDRAANAVQGPVTANAVGSSSALYERFSSRGDFANKLLSAMRDEFGGHIEKPAKT